MKASRPPASYSLALVVGICSAFFAAMSVYAQQYAVAYAYNATGQVVQTAATMPDGVWRAEYTYGPNGVLDRARVLDPTGTLVQEHQYQRDQQGRLIRKKIADPSGNPLGEVQLTYQVPSDRIVQVVV